MRKKIDNSLIEIKINCKGTHYFSLDELNILQDTDTFELKDLSSTNFNKLKARIESKGFWFPFFIWYSKKEKKWYYTDGTQRYKVLDWMRESKRYKLPDKFPCVEIFAKNKTEAAEAILTQSTNYGVITDEGLFGFINEYNLDFDPLKVELELSDINMEQFESDYFTDSSDIELDIDEKEFDENIETKCKCPKCGYRW
jgi:hypothetical protein